MSTTVLRSRSLDILARGSTCPRCAAWVDEPCRTPSGKETLPHGARIDRACAQYLAIKGEE